MTINQQVAASSSKNRTVNGFLILGYPRITSLQLGDDLFTRKIDNTAMGQDQKAPSTNAELLFNNKRNYMTYYQLRAMYVVFAESNQSAFQASLSADIKK